MKTELDLIVEKVSALSHDEFIILWNDTVGETYTDDVVYWHVTDVACFMEAEKAMRSLYFGDVRNWDDAVQFNGYGDLVSFYPLDHVDALAQFIFDNDCLGSSDAREIKEAAKYALEELNNEQAN